MPITRAPILGGRNIGDEYFGASSVVAFGDLDVLVHGPVVREASTAFDEYWNSDASYPIDRLRAQARNPTHLPLSAPSWTHPSRQSGMTPYVVEARERTGSGDSTHAMPTSPGARRCCFTTIHRRSRVGRQDTQGHLMSQLKALGIEPTQRAADRVAVLRTRGKGALRGYAGWTGRGVRVTVLTNSLAATDVTAVHAGYQRYRKDLLVAGVHLYEMKPVVADKTRGTEKIDVRLIEGIAACQDLCVRSHEHLHRLDESRSAFGRTQYGDRYLLRERRTRGTGGRTASEQSGSRLPGESSCVSMRPAEAVSCGSRRPRTAR